MQMLAKHKIFVSYQQETDDVFQNNLGTLLGNRNDVIVSRSAQMGNVGEGFQSEPLFKKIRDEHLGSTNVTVVLIGADTWKSKQIDWEIGASLWQTPFNPRSGLMGILLPTYNFPMPNQYDPYTIPPRLQFNLQCGFAKIHNWNDDPEQIHTWLEEAFRQRVSVEPDNSYPLFAEDRTEETWNPQQQPPAAPAPAEQPQQ